MSMQFDITPTIRHEVVNKLFNTNIFSRIKFPEGLHSSENRM